MRCLLAAACLLLGSAATHSAEPESLPPIPPIKRLLPPPGIAIPDDVRQELQSRLAELEPRIARIGKESHRADIEVFTKAVRFALRFGEFYDDKDFAKARWALDTAQQRLEQAERGEAPWLKSTGLVVRGYYSPIDESVQPYGMVIPDGFDFEKPCRQIVFLHGRGDKQTDLHFLHERAHRVGEIPAPPQTIVLHPFGRHCLGFKSAGEIDVLDVAAAGNANDSSRGLPLLMGFSMGGAGAWHIGAHYPQHFAAVFPGAGFVDVARYQRLRPEAYPPWYEQALWGAYDVPCYTRNLFNLPVVAYSGEEDKQKDAADIMAESFSREGRELVHLIGPKTGHKYHPETKQELLARIDKILAESSPPSLAPEASLQTRTLRYNAAGWLTAYGLEEHWKDARLDGRINGNRYEITTRNVTRFAVELGATPNKRTFVVDGQEVPGEPHTEKYAYLERRDGRWQQVDPFTTTTGKHPRMQGPIDDAFLEPFIVVLPSGKSRHPRVQQWMEFEIARLRERWGAAFRGELPVILDTEVTDEIIASRHLVCFGDWDSNAVLKRAAGKLPLRWDEKTLSMAGRDYDAATHLPLLIYRNPLQKEDAVPKYLVVNSGPTFREAHDRTNSLQNPKLPDWAIVDITTPPDAEKPGKVVAADFFDEEWQVKRKESGRN